MIFASRARIPPLPLPCLIATARASPSTICISRSALADQIGAFLDRGAIRRGARAHRPASSPVSASAALGLCRRGENAGGQPVERFGQQGLKRRAVLARTAGVGRGRAVDAALQRMLAQHHLGMLGEIAVHLDAG